MDEGIVDHVCRFWKGPDGVKGKGLSDRSEGSGEGSVFEGGRGVDGGCLEETNCVPDVCNVTGEG